MCAQESGAYADTPVSYTHLDVYKRQKYVLAYKTFVVLIIMRVRVIVVVSCVL